MAELPLVVVGASLAGLRAVESARSAGWSGGLVLVGAEEHLPYDRPPLSKAGLAAGDEPAPTTLRTEAELAELKVELRLGAPATGLDVDAGEIALAADSLAYSGLVVATGSHARHLPGESMPGVCVLRTVEDARAVRAALDAGARTVVVGAGFIGSETASAAQARGLPVTIVEAADVPLLRAVGPVLAPALAALHARAGVELRCGIGVSGLEGDGRVERVRLDDGSTLDADLVVVGTGSVPSTDWLEGSGLTIKDGVVCDETLRAAENVYAAGDVARWTNPLFGREMRLEHWTAAAEQGAHAGRCLADPAGATAFSTVPYAWSDFYGHRLQVVGVTTDDMTVVGELTDDSWVALFREQDRIVGAVALNRVGRVMKLKRMVAAKGAFQDALDLARR